MNTNASSPPNTLAEVYALVPAQLLRIVQDWRPLVLQNSFDGHLDAFSSGEEFNFTQYQWRGDSLPRSTFSRVQLRVLYEKGDSNIAGTHAGMASVWLDDKPVMVIQNASPNFRRKWISDAGAFIEMCHYVRSELLHQRPDIRRKLADVADGNADVRDLLHFYGHNVIEYDFSAGVDGATPWSFKRFKNKEPI